VRGAGGAAAITEQTGPGRPNLNSWPYSAVLSHVTTLLIDWDFVSWRILPRFTARQRRGHRVDVIDEIFKFPMNLLNRIRPALIKKICRSFCYDHCDSQRATDKRRWFRSWVGYSHRNKEIFSWYTDKTFFLDARFLLATRICFLLQLKILLCPEKEFLQQETYCFVTTSKKISWKQNTFLRVICRHKQAYITWSLIMRTFQWYSYLQNWPRYVLR